MRPILLSVLLAHLAAAQTPVRQSKPEHPAKRPNNLLMRDFKPASTLHLPQHEISRAKFPVIDIHNHVNDARSAGRNHKDPAELVRMMDQLNIKTLVILTGGWGARLQKVIDEMVKPYPGRFVTFTQVDWSRIDEPKFGEAMAEQVRDSVKRGARGLKILKELGLEVRDKSGHLIKVDDARLDPIWEECGRLNIPVAIHVADPEAFFRPIDPTNERYEELSQYPEWSFCCPPKFPTLKEILDARDQMIARHPKTTFILLHVGNWPENLDYVEQTLKRFPNTVVEFGAREAELGRQPRRAREIFLKYPDRVLFGTDMEPTAPLYRNYFRWLETADEYFPYFGYPVQGFWNISGLYLPDDVLRKVYSGNAERILSRYKGSQ